MFKKIKRDGISLRTAQVGLIVLAVIVSALLLFVTFRAANTFQRVSTAADEYIEMQKAASQLMDASDYLTEMVQRFTVDGNEKYMEEYFKEAFETKRREEAIAIMSGESDNSTALKQLQQAMDESKDLMNREYYAMKLVLEAQNAKDYPEVLKDVQLTAEDAQLPPEEQMDLAQEMVLDDAYYEQKDRIRTDMKNSLQEVEKKTHSAQEQSEKTLKSELQGARIIILLQVFAILITIWMTTKLGISPILKAVEKIKDDSPVPEIGANEFRYLARTYNKMYDVYKKSIAHLNYKASHDELTGVYNRAGYDLILSGVEVKTASLILLDGDHFKEINDTFGHETGDKILQKIANSVSANFRRDDYVCRIGGDEFVVLMTHTSESMTGVNEQVAKKVMKINGELADTKDGLPEISISAGIAHGADTENWEELFANADTALYERKHAGGHGLSCFN